MSGLNHNDHNDIIPYVSNNILYVPKSYGNKIEEIHLNQKTIFIGMCKLLSIPAELFDFEHITKLTLFQCELSDIPYSISKLKNLEVVDIDILCGISIKSFPLGLCECLNITKLKLTMHIEHIPSSIKNLTQLRELDLYGNQITYIPDELSYCTHLEKISIMSTIKTCYKFPYVLCTLEHLTCISIGSNEFSNIYGSIFVPRQLAKCKSLTKLRLGGTTKSMLPVAFEHINLDVEYDSDMYVPVTTLNIMTKNLLGTHCIGYVDENEIPTYILDRQLLTDIECQQYLDNINKKCNIDIDINIEI